MAEIKEDIIDEILDDEDRAKLAELDKKADTKKMADNLENLLFSFVVKVLII